MFDKETETQISLSVLYNVVDQWFIIIFMEQDLHTLLLETLWNFK